MGLRAALRRWLLGPEASPPPATRRAPRISHETLAQLGYGRKEQAPPFVDAFTRPEPPPGLQNPKLAMDQQVDALWGWAGLSQWAEGIGFMGYAYLAELCQRAEYRKPSEIIAKEMTRKWIKLQAVGDEQEQDDQDADAPSDREAGEAGETDADEDAAEAATKAKEAKLDALEAAMKTMNLQQLFRQLAEQDGYFGRAQLYVDVDGAWDKDPDELAKPLLDQKVKQGSKLRFVLVEPMWSYPGTYNASDPLDPTFFKPQTWTVMSRTIHASRLLTFVSRPVPDILKPAYAFGGMALSQLLKPYVDNWIRTRQSVSDLLHSFSIPVVKTNLSAVLNDQGSEFMVHRAEMFIRSRDNRGAALIDKESEDMVLLSVPLGSLDKLQAQAQEQMAAVAGIPLVVLLGVTPSGLNASSDGDIRTFYAWVQATQEQLFTRHLTRVLELLQLSLFGEVDPAIGFTYVPLWQLDEKTLADLRKVEADTAAVYIESAVLDPHEQRVVLAGAPDSPYASLDLSPEADPEKPEDDEAIQGELKSAIHDDTANRAQPSGGAADQRDAA